MDNQYYSHETDQKWQARWKESGIYRFDESKLDKKFYLLEMFSYPSGKNLHLGHWWNFSLADSYGRMKRMQGYEVFHPTGFDAFGLPAENYAIKTGIHPQESTWDSIRTMREQLGQMGTTYDWNYEIVTCDPSYYRWTQWIFVKLLEHGLAYRKEAPINWCPSCQTVLANEQAAGGVCERCGTPVHQKKMTQWFFKITQYAQELLDGIHGLDWLDKTKKIQENWIGKKEGCEISFSTEYGEITVFTTRPDTLMGVTYLILSPEHPMAGQLASPEFDASVREYQESAASKSEIERMAAEKEKTGVFTGSWAIHPITGEKIPIWIGDYILASAGTGAVMGVPAHDERDYDFAQKYHLPIKRVITGDAPLPFPALMMEF